MKVKVKVNIMDDGGEAFMGPGLLQLLNLIHEQRSINRAAKEMRLSYVKALHLLNRLEASLGEKVLIRKRGGNEHGGAELTPQGERFIREYRELEARIAANAERELALFLTQIDKT